MQRQRDPRKSSMTECNASETLGVVRLDSSAISKPVGEGHLVQEVADKQIKEDQMTVKINEKNGVYIYTKKFATKCNPGIRQRHLEPLDRF